MEDSFWNLWTVLGAIVVLGGGAWTGAKAAFFTTLFFKVLFGKASEPTPAPTPQPQPQPQIVLVPMWGGAAGNAKDMRMADWDDADWDDADIIDVTPRVAPRRTDWVE